MITGTYDIQVTSVYPDLVTMQPAFTGPQWQLFRSGLKDGRENWQTGHPGVLIDRVNIFPVSSITSTYSTRVENLGAGYIEFLPNPSIGANDALSVTFTINLALFDANRVARVSVLPIGNFGNSRPGNVFLSPQAVLPLTSRYTFRVENFKQCDRITLIANAVTITKDVFDYSYLAQVITPAGPPSPSPCLLVLP